MNDNADLTGIELAESLILEYREEIQSTDNDFGIEKYKELVLQIIDHPWIPRLLFNEDPASELEQRLTILCDDAQSSHDAFDAGREIVKELASRNVAIPPTLAKWASEVESGHRTRPRKSGPSKYKYLGRDLHIAAVIHRLELSGIKPTRNDESSHESSGCDLVITALQTTLGLYMSYAAIKSIWIRYSNPKDPLTDL